MYLYSKWSIGLSYIQDILRKIYIYKSIFKIEISFFICSLELLSFRIIFILNYFKLLWLYYIYNMLYYDEDKLDYDDKLLKKIIKL